MPGFSKKEVEVALDGDLLEVTVHRQNGEDPEQADLKRTFRLPEGIEQKKSKASLQNGILKILLPKKAAREPLKLKIG